MTQEMIGPDPYIKRLIESRERPAVIKIQFLNFRSQHPEGLVVTVEGDDDKVVYSYWIRRVNPDIRYEFFVSGGKRGIKKLKNTLFQDRSGADKGVVYLVDRDYDDLNGFSCIKNVFMLDRYSIENYLTEREVIDQTIKVAFPGSGKSGFREAICSQFETDLSQFLQASVEVNKRIFVARRLGLDIDDVIPDSINKIAAVSIGKVAKDNTPPHDLIPYDLEVDKDILAQLEKEFSDLDPLSRYRGKFIIKFMRSWLSLLCEAYKKRDLDLLRHIDVEQGKIKQEEMTLGALACRSPLPEGFPTFISEAAGSAHDL